MKSKNWFIFLLGACLIIFGLVIIFPKPQIKVIPSPAPENLPTYAKVTRVFDGDTIEIESGKKVRYIGINSSEVYPVRGCFADEERKANEKLVLGKTVKLIKDTSETDKYGRLLRYVYVDESTFVNEYLVRNGFAEVMTIPPDTKFKEEFANSENYAKENNLGLWGKCGK